MTHLDNINRRKFDRFSFKDTFVLETENFNGISSTSSINMSQKGAHLISLKPLPKGSIVSIEVPSQKIQMMGEVCWIGPEHDQKFDVGISFHDFFPTTKAKIANLIDRIQVEPDSSGPVFSFELEKNVSMFLDKFIEDIRPEPIVQAPVSYRRLGTPTEKSISFYTPSKPATMEGTTTSFRIDEKIAAVDFPLRPILLTMLALSLFFFRETFMMSLQNLSTQQAASTISAPAKAVAAPTPVEAEPTQATFQDGLIEKIEWTGTTDKLQMVFSFRTDIKSDQIQITKMNFDDHPRQLIKILDIDGKLDQKNTQIDHALVNQVRLGIHEENGHKNLHIVMDMTSSNVSVASTEQTDKNLIVRLQYGSK